MIITLKPGRYSGRNMQNHASNAKATKNIKGINCRLLYFGPF